MSKRLYYGSNLLPIIVDVQAPLLITVQIAEQIKLLIAMGHLKPGDALPTVIQLAEHLQINHNTIASVYTNLIEAGYLVAKRGRGTFVAENGVVQQAQSRLHFYQLLEQAFGAATATGLSPSEFGAVAYARAMSLSQRTVAPVQLVFVECLLQDAGSYFYPIQAEIDRPLLFLQLEDLQSDQPEALSKLRTADLVMTAARHVREVFQITAPEQEVVGVVAQPDLHLLAQIAALPRDTQVLLICRELVGGETMKQMLEQYSVSHLSLQAAGIEQIQQNRQLLDKADVVCASRLVYDYVREISFQPEKVMKFSFGIDQASTSILKARLEGIYKEKVKAING